MKVLHVLRDARPFGGKQRYVKEVAELLLSQGHEVVLLSMDEAVRAWGVLAYTLPRLRVGDPNPLRRALAAAQRLYNLDVVRLMGWLHTMRFDVAHLHDHAHFSVALLHTLARANLPLVYTLHDYQLLCPVSVLFREHDRVPCEACQGGRYWNAVRYRCSHRQLANSFISALDTWLIENSGAKHCISVFIAPSRSVIDTFTRFGWSKARFVHLPHFTKLDSPSPRRETQIYQVLSVARLWNQKGIDLLLQAAALLRTRRLQIVVVGDGPRRAQLQALAASLNLQNALFLGHLDPDAIRPLYKKSICLVASSLGVETFGLVILEAFAARCPVIASRIGGLSEIVDDGVDGWLVPPGDVEALAERLDWMLSHPAQAAEMGEAGYRKVIAQYTPSRHYQGLLEIYNQAIIDHWRVH